MELNSDHPESYDPRYIPEMLFKLYIEDTINRYDLEESYKEEQWQQHREEVSSFTFS